MRLSIPLALSFAACTTGAPEALEHLDERLSADVGSFDIEVDNRPRFTSLGGGDFTITITGETNTPLARASSFVPYGALGTTTLLPNDRDFRIVLDHPDETNTLLSGLDLLLEMTTTASQTYTARVGLAPVNTQLRRSGGVTMRRRIQPVYVLDPVDPLRYRVVVDTAAAPPELTVSAGHGVAPAVTAVQPGRWHVDFTYDSFVAAAAPGPGADRLRVASTDAGGHVLGTATSVLSVRANSLFAGQGDAYGIWPEPTCEQDVYDCVFDTLGGDYGSCGFYRAVSRCIQADACDHEPAATLSLRPTSSQGIDDAATARGSSCGNVGTWCGIDDWSVSTTPRCLGTPPSLEDVTALALVNDRNWSGFSYAWGTTYDSSNIGGVFLFSTSYGADGPAFLQSVYQWVGSRDVQAWYGSIDVPCHNCTDFDDILVMWFEDVGKVVVIEGNHGWDS